MKRKRAAKLLSIAGTVVLTILSYDHMSVLWKDPTGVKMVVVALILQVMGTLIIRKLVDVEY